MLPFRPGQVPSTDPEAENRALRANPLLALPAIARLRTLDPPVRGALRDVLMDLRADARVRAEKSWRTRKAPMAAYWAAVSVYAAILRGHFAKPQHWRSIMFNFYQRACAATFGGGDFAHVTTIEEARGVHDTLFTFLMIELSTDEGCLDQETAIRRLATAAADIDGVMDAIFQQKGKGAAA